MGDGEPGEHRTYPGLIVDNAGRCAKQDRDMTSWDKERRDGGKKRE